MKNIARGLCVLVALLMLGGCGTVDNELENIAKEETTISEFTIGETWNVEGQWSLTVSDVTEVQDRNEFSDLTPAAVYVVTYEYTNLGYVDSNGFMDGLYFVMDETIVDAAGKMGYSYPGDIVKYPQETPVGATCEAQVCVGVDNTGPFKITVSLYDGNDVKQMATFNISVE